LPSKSENVRIESSEESNSTKESQNGKGPGSKDSSATSKISQNVSNKVKEMGKKPTESVKKKKTKKRYVAPIIFNCLCKYKILN